MFSNTSPQLTLINLNPYVPKTVVAFVVTGLWDICVIVMVQFVCSLGAHSQKCCLFMVEPGQ